LNGRLAASNAYTGSFSALKNGDLNRLGSTVSSVDLTDVDPPFQGQLAELRVWNVARTEEQIRKSMAQKLTGQETGLVGLWNFDDPANPGRDASPGAHHGTLRGNAQVVPSTAPTSMALSLDGDSNLETGAVVVDTAQDWTIECWAFAPASAAGAFRHLVAQDHQLYFGFNPEGKIRMGDSWNNTGVSYPFGAWHHFAVVKHSAGAELYVDGMPVAKKEGLLPPPAAVATFRIGRQRSRSDQEWTERWLGAVDEVRVWSVARTAEQIRANYLRNLEGTEADLVGLWNFDDPTKPGKDLSGGQHAQMVGDAKVVTANRPGSVGSEIRVVDEPLPTLVPVEQRVRTGRARSVSMFRNNPKWMI
jgi:hypothetical protein